VLTYSGRRRRKPESETRRASLASVPSPTTSDRTENLGRSVVNGNAGTADANPKVANGNRRNGNDAKEDESEAKKNDERVGFVVTSCPLRDPFGFLSRMCRFRRRLECTRRATHPWVSLVERGRSTLPSARCHEAFLNESFSRTYGKTRDPKDTDRSKGRILLRSDAERDTRVSLGEGSTTCAPYIRIAFPTSQDDGLSKIGLSASPSVVRAEGRPLDSIPKRESRNGRPSSSPSCPDYVCTSCIGTRFLLVRRSSPRGGPSGRKTFGCTSSRKKAATAVETARSLVEGNEARLLRVRGGTHALLDRRPGWFRRTRQTKPNPSRIEKNTRAVLDRIDGTSSTAPFR
jgi:hypothetical protein